MKRIAVVLNGSVINIGPWDTCVDLIDVANDPMPKRAKEGDFYIVSTDGQTAFKTDEPQSPDHLPTRCVVLDDEVICMGPWPKLKSVVAETNPLPAGALEGEFDIKQDAAGRYILA